MRLIRRHLSTATHHKKSRRLIVDPGGSAVRSKTVRSCRFYSRPAAKPLRSRPPILRRKVASGSAGVLHALKIQSQRGSNAGGKRLGAGTIVNGRRIRPQHRGHRWYRPDLNIERDLAYLIGRGFAFAVIARGDSRGKVVSAHRTRALAELAAKAFGGKNPPESSKSRPSRNLRARYL